MDYRKDMIALYRQLLREIEGGSCDYETVRDILARHNIYLNNDCEVEDDEDEN